MATFITTDDADGLMSAVDRRLTKIVPDKLFYMSAQKGSTACMMALLPRLTMGVEPSWIHKSIRHLAKFDAAEVVAALACPRPAAAPRIQIVGLIDDAIHGRQVVYAFMLRTMLEERAGRCVAALLPMVDVDDFEQAGSWVINAAAYDVDIVRLLLDRGLRPRDCARHFNLPCFGMLMPYDDEFNFAKLIGDGRWTAAAARWFVVNHPGRLGDLHDGLMAIDYLLQGEQSAKTVALVKLLAAAQGISPAELAGRRQPAPPPPAPGK